MLTLVWIYIYIKNLEKKYIIHNIVIIISNSTMCFGEKKNAEVLDS